MGKTKKDDKAAPESVQVPAPIAEPTQVAPTPATGPYLSAALIAEAILVERDNNRTSIIRVVDKIGIAPEATASLKIDEVVTFALTLFVSFRAGGYSGQSHLMIAQVFDPSGDSEPIGLSQFQFNGTLRDLWEVKLPLSMLWKGPGQYWIDVYLDNKLFSRVPFEITIDGPPTVTQ